MCTGGVIFSIDTGFTDPNNFAIGMGDSCIRIWKAGKMLVPSSKISDPFNSVCIWRGLQAKITVVSFHPTEPGIVAYGLEDGRIGIYR